MMKQHTEYVHKYVSFVRVRFLVKTYLCFKQCLFTYIAHSSRQTLISTYIHAHGCSRIEKEI